MWTHHWPELPAASPATQQPLLRIVHLEFFSARRLRGYRTRWWWRRLDTIEDNFCSTLEDMVRMIVNAAPSHERHVVDGHVHSDATETKSLNQ